MIEGGREGVCVCVCVCVCVWSDVVELHVKLCVFIPNASTQSYRFVHKFISDMYRGWHVIINGSSGAQNCVKLVQNGATTLCIMCSAVVSALIRIPCPMWVVCF